ncbi:MAG: thioredoxin fold domain-containing protein [Gammaproteobacteria bacterium]|nr:thioredoxin fold domain-containing protein [Gammaproteobacteria bacterium]
MGPSITRFILVLSVLLADTHPAAAPSTSVALGPTELMAAVERGEVAAMDRLLGSGAPPDAANRQGETALHLATAQPLAITERLTAAGANIDARDAGGVSVLMRAAGRGRRDLVEHLLAAGARLDFKDYEGASAVHWAGRAGHRELARFLTARLEAQPSPAHVPDRHEFAEDVFVDVEFPDWFKESFLDLDVNLGEALDARKQGIMLFVSTRRCSYCKAFLDKSLSRQDIRQRLTDAFDIIGLEIFDDSMMTAVDGTRYRVKEFVKAEKASLTPTLIFYGEGGRRLLKIVGYYPPERFRQVLDYLEGGHHRHMTLRSFMAARPSPTVSSKTRPALAEDTLFATPPHILDRRGAASDRPLMVLFEERDCPACARFHRRVLADEAIRGLLEEYEVRRLEIGDRETPVITPTGEGTTAAAWYGTLGLSYAPAVVLFDRQGREVMRIDSETLRFRMEGSLQMVLEDTPPEDPQLQRWRRDKAIRARTAVSR